MSTKTTKQSKVVKPESLSGILHLTPETNRMYEKIRYQFSKLARAYGFQRVEFPILIDHQFLQMYYKSEPEILTRLISFQQQDASLSLRPETLPQLVSTYVGKKVSETHPLSKWSYFSNTFSFTSGQTISEYDYGMEVFGSFSHLGEAQTISVAWDFFLACGLSDITLEINHMGDGKAEIAYSEAIESYFKNHKYDLCDDCNERLYIRPQDIFRCQNVSCQTIAQAAPNVLEFLDDKSNKHFTLILEALDEIGLPYQLNPCYMPRAGTLKTAFAISYKSKNNKFYLVEGGHHDSLLVAQGLKAWNAFGFSGKLSKLITAMEDSSSIEHQPPSKEVCLVPLGELAAKKALRLFRELNQSKVSVYDLFGQAGVKDQLKTAIALKIPIALILGQKEAVDEVVILRDVKSGMQEVFAYDKIIVEVKKRLGY